MSQLTLREYLTGYLPNATDNARTDAFFNRTDVAALLKATEQLISQLVASWPADSPADLPAEKLEPAQEITPEPVVGNVPEPENEAPLQPSAETDYAFLVPDSELQPETPAEQPATSSTHVSEIHDIGHPSTSPADDTVRFQPTTKPESTAPQRTLTIPNATVGKPYAYTFDFAALGLPPVSTHSLALDPASGLTYDPATYTLSGKPTGAGEFSFELTYRPQTAEPGRPALVRIVDLLVNPDPRSLWKDLPSDSLDRYFRPDSDRNSVLTDEASLIAASVRGRSHAHEGKFRDDDFSLAHFDGPNWYLLSVADGAGSARYARKGAQLACHSLTTYLATVDASAWQALDDTIVLYAAEQTEQTHGAVQRQLYALLGKGVFGAFKAIETEAKASEALLKEYSTTLITVLAKPMAGGWFVGGFWVGDGGVSIYRAGHDPILLGTPDGGEYAGQTRFLTMPEIFNDTVFNRFQFAFVPDFTAVILMTDGVTDPKFQTDNNLKRPEKWDELWADLVQGVTLTDDQAPSQLQEWLTFWSPGNHDDRTIALLYPHAPNHTN